MTASEAARTDCQCSSIEKRIGDMLQKNGFPVSWERIGSNNIPLQSANDIYEETHRCDVCGRTFTLVESVGGFRIDACERASSAAGKTIDTAPADEFDARIAERFCGTWKDDQGGRTLIITRDDRMFFADLLDGSGKPVIRSLPGGDLPSLRMPGSLRRGELSIELGAKGLGPVLSLQVTGTEATSLIPRIAMGLYDDWEDDFGVPWILPLSEWRRQ